MVAGKNRELGPKKLERFGRNTRKAQTAKAGRALVAFVKLKSPSGKPGFAASALPKDHDPKNRLSRLEIIIAAGKKGIPRIYRDLWKRQDEMVRTSLITDLLLGVQKEKFKPPQAKTLSAIIKSFSGLRFPTKWTGFKLKNGYTIAGFTEMQHPTSANTGMWNPKISGFSRAHTVLDDARVKVAIDTMNSFVKTDAGGVVSLKSKQTPETFVKGVTVATGTFSLRNMIAPAMASNVDSNGSTAEKKAQTKLRDVFLKKRLVANGAKYAKLKLSGLGTPQQEFRPDLLKPGEVSPARFP